MWPLGELWGAQARFSRGQAATRLRLRGRRLGAADRLNLGPLMTAKCSLRKSHLESSVGEHRKELFDRRVNVERPVPVVHKPLDLRLRQCQSSLLLGRGRFTHACVNRRVAESAVASRTVASRTASPLARFREPAHATERGGERQVNEVPCNHLALRDDRRDPPA